MKQTALCLLVLMLALAACGGGDKPGSPKTAPGVLVASLEGMDEQGMIDPGGTLVVRFSEPMSPTSARPPITASPRTALRAIWSEDFESLMVSSQRYFTPGTSVALTLGETLRSASGKTFPAPPGWTVLVHDAAHLVKRPTVSLSSGGRTLVSLLEFSLGMDTSSVEAALSVNPDLPLQLTWTGAGLKVESTTMPQPSTEYDFLLRKEARDLQGRPLPEDIRWSFRTAGLAATPGLPGPEFPDAAIILRFNYALDEAHALEAFYIDPAVSGEAELDEEGTELTFSPAGPLPFSSTFEVGFSKPLLSAGGASLPPVAPQQFSIPGPVTFVSPADYEVVEPPGTVKIQFTRAMDTPSVEAAFTIQPDVEGTLSWERNTLVFTPQAGRLAESTDYDIALGPDVATADGDHPLVSGYRWTFRTTETPPAAVFSTYGPNLRVVGPGRDTPINYESLSNFAGPITFSLYQLSAEEFADRYAHHFRQDQWWGEEREDIPVRGAKLDLSWDVDNNDRCSYESCSQETSIPGRLDSGLYLLQASADGATDEMFLVASSLRVAVKTYAGQVVVWVTDAFGNPKAGADVQVAIANGQIGSQGTTDEEGLYETWVFGSDQPVLAIANKGDQIAVSGLDSSWDSIAARGCGGSYSWWGEPWDTSHGPVRLLAQLHTDRPIYRPGQTVYYKAILRKDEDALVSQLPEGTPVTVEVLDSGRNVLQTEGLKTNAFGTVDGSIALSEGAMLGSYAVQVRVGDDSFHQEFKVEDYRKPDFEVRLSLDADRYVAGDTIRATLEAEYFLGQPVAGAAVELTRYRVFSWWGWETDAFGYTDTLDYEPSPIGRTDEQGLLSFEIPTEGLSDWYWDEEWFHRDVFGIEVTLDDGSHQSVSAFVRAPVYSSSERIDLLAEGYYHRRGESFPLRARVTDLDGRPVSGRVLTWSLNRYDDDTFDSMTETEAEFTTGDDGLAQTDVVFTHPGWYEVTIRGVDSQGNATSRSRWFYVTGTTQRTRPGSTLEVYADRDTYAPGDTAHVIVESSFDGPALLTFERASVRRQQIIELTPPVTELDLPIRTDDVPNVFVTVSAWGPPGDWWYVDEPPWDLLETATVELTVPAEGKELHIEASADRAAYGPGDEAEFTLQVTDWAGRPVAAEVSLSLVDEAIYSLSEDLSPPLMMAFYARRSHLVETYDSLAPWLAMYGDGCGGGGGGPGVPSSPRSDFPDTAIWLPRILTGDDGIAHVKVSLPDNLTSWRLTVRAVTQDSRVGETRMNIVTRLPLAVRSLLPRSLTDGDTATLAAAVHNGSEEPLVARVGLVGTSLGLLEPQVQEVELRPGESQIVHWSAEITQSGEALIRLSAESDEYRDSLQMSIPVSPLAVREVNSVSGSTLSSTSIPFVIPQDAAATSTIRLDLSRDATRSLLDGLEYLTGYPYGCVEQIMSAALPNAVIARAFRGLGILDTEFEADLSERIRDGLQRLYSMQHPDGGWGWWYDDTTDAYQTSWVLFGLAVTREAGYPVDDGVLDRAANWVLSDLPTMDPRTRAFALYSLAMAGRGQRDQALSLVDGASQLDPFALSALALALEREGESEAAVQMAETLKSRVMVTDGMAHFWISGSDGEYNSKTMASKMRPVYSPGSQRTGYD